MNIKRFFAGRSRLRLLLLIVTIGSFLWTLTRGNCSSRSSTSILPNRNQTVSFLHNGIKNQTPESPYRVMADNCSGSLEIPLEDIKAKISSYGFSGVEQYINDLFPSKVLNATPEFPYFVTALSSNHFEEGKIWLESFKKIPRERYPNSTLYLYDIGLTIDEAAQIRNSCDCIFRRFPFERFPEHVRNLRVYAWKPIIIQLVVKEHPFIIWMDTSVAFIKPCRLDHLISEAKSKGVLAAKSPAKVANRVFQDTFEFLKEVPCLYRHVNIFGARFIVAYMTSFELNYLLKPWVSCALIPHCIMTSEYTEDIVDCTRIKEEVYFKCHRFDQGVFSILMHRLYHKRAMEHAIIKVNGSNLIRTRRL